ncbi:MAG: YlaH-like family protein [Bacillaceae bacterium]
MANDRLSFFAQLYGVGTENSGITIFSVHIDGMKLLFLTIFLLCVIVYKLGFAKKLPLFKSIIIYVVMFLFTSVLTFLGAFSPIGGGVGIAEGLVIAAVFLGIYKIRLIKARGKKENMEV